MQLAPLYPVIHQFLKPLFPSCLWVGDQQVPAIALTFDDGPHPHYTPQLLQVLDRYGIPASFFLLGLCVSRSPAIAHSIYQSNHWLGLHGFDHRSFTTLSSVELKQTLDKTQAEIVKACHLSSKTVWDVRPPNGFFTPKTLDLLQQWSYRPVMWSVVPEDWVSPGVSTVVARILQQVTNGSIIVLHDGYTGGVDVAEVVDRLIPLLLQRGYYFVTIDQLWQQENAPRLKQ
ncbi:polysaccharide deacetylase family protein [Phormidium sp. CLA17]|uniref:polysaccharide deacetylase family protein n=1 Tax=Leptolyngbya sp. Cla-17 TaxID=2803751 RepID=UPI001490EB6A|nr:polysaccharide deacetylase family protein [Leptolyngbya sp. Cla-17]MBM0741543.1 polysaccharide deacetylase family protein [Leptolyngbya sp. Cla-17]